MRRKVLLLILFLLINLNVYAAGEATITNIKVNGKDCTCTGYDCSIEVDASKGTVTYELVDAEASVDRLSGFTVDLNSQVTLVKIIVSNDKGEAKIENTYNISINLHEKNSDYSLKSLKVNGSDIELLEEVYVYSYDANYNDDKIKVEAETNDPNARIKIEDEYSFPLDNSSSIADFIVTAENGEERSYRIVLKRGARPDTTLKSLNIKSGNINFKSNIYEYHFTVEYSVNKLDIEYEPTNKKAKVEVKNDDLVVGENEIVITVSIDDVSTDYKLFVTREENMDKSIANLKKLVVTEYPKLDFEGNVLEYNLKFSEIPEKLNIKAEAIDSNATVEILHNENLVNDSKVIIKVSLKDSTITREYSLRLIEEKNDASNDKKMIIISIVILIIVIIVMFILEIKDKKNLRRKKLMKILELKRKKEKVKKEINKKVEKEEDIEII